jgi:hypothetical protein
MVAVLLRFAGGFEAFEVPFFFALLAGFRAAGFCLADGLDFALAALCLGLDLGPPAETGDSVDTEDAEEDNEEEEEEELADFELDLPDCLAVGLPFRAGLRRGFVGFTCIIEFLNQGSQI